MHSECYNIVKFTNDGCEVSVMNWKRWSAAVLSVTLALCLTACGVQITGISLPESLEIEAGASETLAVEYAT